MIRTLSLNMQFFSSEGVPKLEFSSDETRKHERDPIHYHFIDSEANYVHQSIEEENPMEWCWTLFRNDYYRRIIWGKLGLEDCRLEFS